MPDLNGDSDIHALIEAVAEELGVDGKSFAELEGKLTGAGFSDVKSFYGLSALEISSQHGLPVGFALVVDRLARRIQSQGNAARPGQEQMDAADEADKDLASDEEDDSTIQSEISELEDQVAEAEKEAEKKEDAVEKKKKSSSKKKKSSSSKSSSSKSSSSKSKSSKKKDETKEERKKRRAERKKRKERRAARRLRRKIRIVQDSWNLVVPIADVAAKLFYNRLFEEHPETKALFTKNMQLQEIKLMRMLDFVVDSLGALGTVQDDIRQLAVKHVAYKVTPEMYAWVGSAFLWTLGQGLGEKFDEKTKGAWADVYGILADTMLTAAKPYYDAASDDDDDSDDEKDAEKEKEEEKKKEKKEDAAEE